MYKCIDLKISTTLHVHLRSLHTNTQMPLCCGYTHTQSPSKSGLICCLFHLGLCLAQFLSCKCWRFCWGSSWGWVKNKIYLHLKHLQSYCQLSQQFLHWWLLFSILAYLEWLSAMLNADTASVSSVSLISSLMNTPDMLVAAARSKSETDAVFKTVMIARWNRDGVARYKSVRGWWWERDTVQISPFTSLIFTSPQTYLCSMSPCPLACHSLPSASAFINCYCSISSPSQCSALTQRYPESKL